MLEILSFDVSLIVLPFYLISFEVYPSSIQTFDIFPKPFCFEQNFEISIDLYISLHDRRCHGNRRAVHFSSLPLTERSVVCVERSPI